MDNLSRESTVLSQGTMDAMMNMSGVNLSDLDMLFKHEFVPEDCLLQDSTFTMSESMPTVEIGPDSTQEMIVPTRSYVSTSQMPCTEDYNGPFAFDVDLSNSSGERTKWEFSKTLNKVFVNMGCKIPLNFKTNWNECGLYVRVLPIFLAQDSFEEPVRSCPAHVTSNKGFIHADHILRCHHQNAEYEKNIESGRLSVIIPLEDPQPGCEWSTVTCSFTCKNSCSVGMNRRSTALIFTLERAGGEVIGRKLINIRICSCPRRDKGKEEEDLKAKMMMTEGPVLDSGSEHGGTRKSTTKKPVKRLSKELVDFQLKVPKSYAASFAKVIKEMILMNKIGRELTSEEEITLQDCEKFIS